MSRRGATASGPGDYSQAVWDDTQTFEDWQRFMQHDAQDPSRQTGFSIIDNYISRRPYDLLAFAEIGFGGANDFDQYFKELRDDGAIIYTGYEITPQFVTYARQAYPGCDFRVGGFLDLAPLSYDITYTRHTLEHIAPDLWEKCLTALLAATRGLCIVSWFMRPGDAERIRQGSDGKAWLNSYYRDKVVDLILAAGFGLTITVCSQSREIYAMERKA